MREIKFRGVTCKSRFHKDGEVVYGHSLDYFMGKDKPQIADESEQGWESIPVKPNSISQLIGVDKKGNEIYEGDEIVSHFGSSCYATFRHYGGIIDGVYILDHARVVA